MEMRARCGVAALPPMDEAALGGPESVEQPRALLHVVAQAEEIGDELLLRFATQARGRRAPWAHFQFSGRGCSGCQSSAPSRPYGGKQAFFN